MRRRRAALAASVALASVLVTACGGRAGEASGSPQARPGSTASSTPTASATDAARTERARPSSTAGEAVDIGDVRSPLELDAFSFTWDEAVPASADEALFTQAWGTYEAPDRLACNVGRAVGTSSDPEVVSFVQTIAIGDRAWVDEGDGWRTAAPDDELVESAQFYCGTVWNVSATGTPAEDFGEPDVLNGIAVRHADLVEEEFTTEIVIGETDVALDRFEVWVTDAGMMLAFDMEGTGAAAPLATSAGWEYEGAPDDVGIYMSRGSITDVNDPALAVEPPDVTE